MNAFNDKFRAIAACPPHRGAPFTSRAAMPASRPPARPLKDINASEHRAYHPPQDTSQICKRCVALADHFPQKTRLLHQLNFPSLPQGDLRTGRGLLEPDQYGGVSVDQAQLLASALGHMEKALILLDEAGFGAEASYQQYAISLAQAKLREVCAVRPPKEYG